MTFFFFNDTATTDIYTLSLHDALPIYPGRRLRRGLPDPASRRTGRGGGRGRPVLPPGRRRGGDRPAPQRECRSEEHTSELQSHHDLVCRLLLEKKKR